MLLIRSSAAMARALDSPGDPALAALLCLRQNQLTTNDGSDLGDNALFLIVQPRDSAAILETQLGFSPLTNPVDGSRFGETEFTPWWEWMEVHEGWFELVFLMTDDGFAHVVFVPDHDEVDAELLALCRSTADIPSRPDALHPSLGRRGA